jgi:hypothetical protein
MAEDSESSGVLGRVARWFPKFWWICGRMGDQSKTGGIITIKNKGYIMFRNVGKKLIFKNTAVTTWNIANMPECKIRLSATKTKINLITY